MGEKKAPEELGDTERSDPPVADAEPAPAATPWAVGDRLGERYVLRRFVGAGGMGEVWVAFDEVLDKEVALKRVRADLVRARAALDSLRREVLLAQTVTHPNVCRIYDLETIGSDWVIKMEVVAGRSLADRLKNTGALPLEEALSLARQLADGLAAVHAVGVVHRDLKPLNVLVSDDGRAVLMDFGIARGDAPSGETDQAQIVGTPEYMAPEQVRAGKLDARADLYALGCLLYRVLTGEVPFPAPTRVATMARHLTDAPPDVRLKQPTVPAWLARLTQELMAKTPEARPPDAATVCRRLAGPPPRWRRASLPLAGLIVALLAVVVGFMEWRQRTHATWQPRIGRTSVDFDEDSLSFAIAPDGKRVAWDGRRNGSWRVYVGPREGGSGQAASGEGYTLLSWSADGRALYVHNQADDAYRIDLTEDATALVGSGITALADCGRFGLLTIERSPQTCPWCTKLVWRKSDGTQELLRPIDPNETLRARLACDGERGRISYALQRGLPSATVGRTHELYVQSIAGAHAAAPRALIEDTAQLMSGPFVGANALLFVRWDSEGEHIWEKRIDNGAERQLTFAGHEVQPQLTPDERELWLESYSAFATLFAFDVASGRTRQLTFDDSDLEMLVPSRDGRTVGLRVRIGDDQALVLRPVDGAPPQTIARGRPLVVAGRELHGEFYFQSFPVGGGRAPLMAVPVDGGAVRHVMDLPPGTLRNVDDTRVRLVRQTGAKVQLLSVARADGSEQIEEPPLPWSYVSTAPHGGWRVALRSDRPKLALFAPEARLDGKPAAALDGGIWSWTDDGAALLYEKNGDVFRRVVATGHEELLFHADNLRDIAGSSDGTTVFYLAAQRHRRRQTIANFGERPPL